MAHFLFCTCITLKLLLPNFSSEVSLTASESDRTQVCTQGNAIPSQTFLLNRMVYLKTSGMSANGTNDEIYPIFAKCYGCFRCFIFVALLNPYNNPTKQVLILSSFCKWRNWSIERVTGPLKNTLTSFSLRCAIRKKVEEQMTLLIGWPAAENRSRGLAPSGCFRPCQSEPGSLHVCVSCSLILSRSSNSHQWPADFPI